MSRRVTFWASRSLPARGRRSWGSAARAAPTSASVFPELCTWRTVFWSTRWNASVWIGSWPESFGSSSTPPSRCRLRSFRSRSRSMPQAARISSPFASWAIANKRCSRVRCACRLESASRYARLKTSSRFVVNIRWFPCLARLVSFRFDAAAQRVTRLFRPFFHHDRLGLRDLEWIDAGDSRALRVDVHHDPVRLGGRHREDRLQDGDDELHRGVVVVVEEDFVELRLLGLGPRLFRDSAFSPAVGVTHDPILAGGVRLWRGPKRFEAWGRKKGLVGQEPLVEPAGFPAAAAIALWPLRMAHQSLCCSMGIPHSRQTRILFLGSGFCPNSFLSNDILGSFPLLLRRYGVLEGFVQCGETSGVISAVSPDSRAPRGRGSGGALRSAPGPVSRGCWADPPARSRGRPRRGSIEDAPPSTARAPAPSPRAPGSRGHRRPSRRRDRRRRLRDGRGTTRPVSRGPRRDALPPGRGPRRRGTNRRRRCGRGTGARSGSRAEGGRSREGGGLG